MRNYVGWLAPCYKAVTFPPDRTMHSRPFLLWLTVMLTRQRPAHID